MGMKVDSSYRGMAENVVLSSPVRRRASTIGGTLFFFGGQGTRDAPMSFGTVSAMCYYLLPSSTSAMGAGNYRWSFRMAPSSYSAPSVIVSFPLCSGATVGSFGSSCLSGNGMVALP